jgi:hypothetical protein
MRKALEMDDEVIRGFVQLHLLEGILVGFAVRAVPFVVSCQSFLLAEPTDAVVYGYS